MGRAPCCDKANVKKGPWSPEEDAKLKEFIEKYGTGGNWIALPHKAGLKRCGKSCRLRWLNYLRPNIKHGEFSDGEDRIICNLFANIGSRWSIIASQLPGRTDNDIKNYWNTKLKKKLIGTVPFPQRKPSQPSFLPHLSTVSSPSLSTLSSYTQKCLTEPISIPSNLLNNTNISTTATTSLLQAQESFVDPTNQYQMQDNLLMFGGEPSCSSSDGSCNQINYGKDLEGSYFYDRVEENQKFINGGGTGGGGVDGWTEKPNGMWGGTPLDYGHDEEIKQLISSNAFNNFFVDENKAQARAMYY